MKIEPTEQLPKYDDNSIFFETKNVTENEEIEVEKNCFEYYSIKMHL